MSTPFHIFSGNSGNGFDQLNIFCSKLSDEQRNQNRAVFLSIFDSLVEREVEIETTMSILKGNLYTGTPFAGKDFDVIIKMVRGSDSDSNDESFNSKIVPGSTIYIKQNDLVSITISKLDFKSNQNVELQTDSAVLRKTNRNLNGRSPDDYIQAVDDSWLSENTDGVNSVKLELGRGMDGWCQFEANKSLFNVTSSYNEDLYTKKLDINSFTAEQIKYAERIARDIQEKSTNNMHLREERGQVQEREYSEEDKFGSVLINEEEYSHEYYDNSSNDQTQQYSSKQQHPNYYKQSERNLQNQSKTVSPKIPATLEQPWTRGESVTGKKSKGATKSLSQGAHPKKDRFAQKNPQYSNATMRPSSTSPSSLNDHHGYRSAVDNATFGAPPGWGLDESPGGIPYSGRPNANAINRPPPGLSYPQIEPYYDATNNPRMIVDTDRQIQFQRESAEAITIGETSALSADSYQSEALESSDSATVSSSSNPVTQVEGNGDIQPPSAAPSQAVTAATTSSLTAGEAVSQDIIAPLTSLPKTDLNIEQDKDTATTITTTKSSETETSTKAVAAPAKSSFKFNINAKEFVFNASAPSFQPKSATVSESNPPSQLPPLATSLPPQMAQHQGGDQSQSLSETGEGEQGSVMQESHMYNKHPIMQQQQQHQQQQSRHHRSPLQQQQQQQPQYMQQQQQQQIPHHPNHELPYNPSDYSPQYMYPGSPQMPQQPQHYQMMQQQQPPGHSLPTQHYVDQQQQQQQLMDRGGGEMAQMPIRMHHPSQLQMQHQQFQPHIVNSEYMPTYPHPHAGGMPYPMYDFPPPHATMTVMDGMGPPQQPQPYSFPPPTMYTQVPMYAGQPMGVNLPGMAPHPNTPQLVMMSPQQPYGIPPVGAPPPAYQSPGLAMPAAPSHRLGAGSGQSPSTGGGNTGSPLGPPAVNYYAVGGGGGGPGSVPASIAHAPSSQHAIPAHSPYGQQQMQQQQQQQQLSPHYNQQQHQQHSQDQYMGGGGGGGRGGGRGGGGYGKGYKGKSGGGGGGRFGGGNYNSSGGGTNRGGGGGGYHSAAAGSSTASHSSGATEGVGRGSTGSGDAYEGGNTASDGSELGNNGPIENKSPRNTNNNLSGEKTVNNQIDGKVENIGSGSRSAASSIKGTGGGT